MRDIAHAISDKIYQRLTGIRGIFSTKLLYVEVTGTTRENKQYRLMMSDADGARARQIYRSNEPVLSPTWSPTGKEVAYVAYRNGRPGIYRQQLATGNSERLTSFSGLNSAPAWSPDGRSMAMVLSKDGNPEIYVMDLATKQLRRLTNHFAIDTEPSWSPDGQSLVFTSSRGGKPQIYRLSLATGAVERLTFVGDYNARGRVLADGERLIMVHRDQGVFHIALQDLKSGRVRILSQTSLDESPTVAPNSATVLYATQSGRRGVLAAANIASGVKFKLPGATGDVREPAWSPFLQ